MRLGELGAEPGPPGGEGDREGVSAPSPEPGCILVPVPTPGHPSCRSQRDPNFRKAFRVRSRSPSGPGGPRRSPGLRQDALWGSHAPAPRDVDCACGRPGLESALNGRPRSRRTSPLREPPGSAGPAARPSTCRLSLLLRSSLAPPRRGAAPAPALVFPSRAGSGLEQGARAHHGQGTLPPPQAQPVHRQKAALLTTRSDMHRDRHLSIWPRDRDLVEIKHLSPRASVSQVFPDSLFSRSPEACPPFRPIIREKNNAVSITHALSTEAL